MVGREMVLSCGLDGDSDEVRGPVRHRERKEHGKLFSFASCSSGCNGSVSEHPFPWAQTLLSAPTQPRHHGQSRHEPEKSLGHLGLEQTVGKERAMAPTSSLTHTYTHISLPHFPAISESPAGLIPHVHDNDLLCS